MNIKTFFYILTCICFCMPLGAGIYEHVAVWPQAYAAPPRSLGMFQGTYCVESAPFWMSIHPVALLLFIITLVLHWRTERRKYILIPFAIYVVVLVITSIYFVPELMRITQTPFADSVDPELQKSGALWINLSLVRAAILFGACFLLISGLTRSDQTLQPG